MKKIAIALATIALIGLGAAPAFAGCADDMKTVKAAWDKTPAGAKKDAAGKEYKNAETALGKKDEKACLAALDKTRTALK